MKAVVLFLIVIVCISCGGKKEELKKEKERIKNEMAYTSEILSRYTNSLKQYREIENLDSISLYMKRTTEYAKKLDSLMKKNDSIDKQLKTL